MTRISRILVAAATLYCFANVASALTISYGDAVNINACTDADPCVLAGAPDTNYLIGGFDHFHATFVGAPALQINWQLTALQDMQIITTGIAGGGPISPNGGNGSAVFNFAAGETKNVLLSIGLDGLLGLNLVTLSGAVNNASSYFTQSTFAFSPNSTGGTLGAPNPNGGNGGNNGGGMSPVPLPAAGWLLVAALGGLGLAKRRSQGDTT